MKEIKYAMTTMTNNSVIIIDELCRSTSVEEGTALAMAIIEKMAESSAYLYITTHYILLTRLYNLYPNIKVWQMETTPIGDDLKTFKLDYRYNLLPGITTVKNYGIYIVRNIWPDTIIKYVDEILDRIWKNPVDHRLGCMDEKLRLKYSIEANFRKLKSQRKLTISKINQYLNKYQSELQKLGYLINVNHLPQHEDLPLLLLQDNPSPLQHSILGEIIDAEANVDTDIRMQEIFTPSINSQQSMDIECQKAKTRMMEIFTQESDQCSENAGMPQNQCFNKSIQNPSAFSDTANYRNVSNFIAENSENIYKLIPEVHIFEDIENLNIPYVYKEPEYILSREDVRGNQPSFHNIEVIPDDNNPRFSNNIKEHGFSLSLHENRSRASTPLINSNYNFFNQDGTNCTVQINNIVGDIGDIQSLKEDLEISCQLLDDDDEFGKEITTHLEDEKNNRTIETSPELYPKNSYLHYVSPVVNIVTGPDNTTLSISENDILNEKFNYKTAVEECKIQIISNILLNNFIGQEQMYQNDMKQNLTTSLHTEKIRESQHNKKEACKDSNENSVEPLEPREDLAPSKHDFNLSGDEGYKISIDKNVNKYSLGGNTGNTTAIMIKEDTISNKKSNTSSDGDIPYINRNFTPTINLNSNNTSSSDKIEVISKSKFGKSTETRTRTSKSPSEYHKINSQINASKDKTSTTSISMASKLRHLDPTTSDTDNQEGDITSKNVDSSLTSASRKRHLDQTTSESTPMQNQNCDTYLEELNEYVQIFGGSKDTEAIDKAGNQYISIMEEANQSNPVCSNNNKSKEFFINLVENSIREGNHENEMMESDKVVNSGSSTAIITEHTYKYCAENSVGASTNNISAESAVSSQHCSTFEEENKTNENSSSHKESDGSSSLKKRKICKRKFAVPVISINRSDRGGESKINKEPSVWGNKLKKKFIPPRKLSAKEIQEDFAIQNKKLLENSNNDSANMSKYLEQLINRPTIEQIQNTTHLALIRKTDEGLQIIPAEPRKKKRKPLPVRRNISSENFNMAIFSDKNAKSFDEYLKSNEKDNKTFNFHFQKQSGANSFEFQAPNEKFSQNTTIIRNKSDESYKCEYMSQESSFSYMTSQQFVNRGVKKNNNLNLTPDGYYKQNKKDIMTIVNKYFNNPSQSSCHSGNVKIKNPSKNIFESSDDFII